MKITTADISRAKQAASRVAGQVTSPLSRLGDIGKLARLCRMALTRNSPLRKPVEDIVSAVSASSKLLSSKGLTPASVPALQAEADRMKAALSALKIVGVMGSPLSNVVGLIVILERAVGMWVNYALRDPVTPDRPSRLELAVSTSHPNST